MHITGTPIPGQTKRKASFNFRPALPNETRNIVKINYGTSCSATVDFSFALNKMTLAYPGCFILVLFNTNLCMCLVRIEEHLHIINQTNIEKGHWHNFNKYKWGNTVFNQNTTYDFDSIKHYGSNYFSSNGQPTISPRVSGISFPKTTPTTTVKNNLPNILLPESYQHPIDYETRGGHTEGDMIFLNGFDPSKPTPRGVAIYGPHRWPNNVIPYDILAIKSASDQAFIVNAMNTLMYAVGTPVQGQTSRRSCVYFRPKLSTEKDFVKITYGTGCSGTVGYWPGSQMTLTLENPGCFYSGTIQHELMHLLGFYHEQSRPDRDSYITVNYQNIQSGLESNFVKYAWGVSVLNQNTAYDYGSIMHYGAYAFSRNNQPTIVPKKSGVTIGQRDKLSAIDIAEIRAYYGC